MLALHFSLILHFWAALIAKYQAQHMNSGVLHYPNSTLVPEVLAIKSNQIMVVQYTKLATEDHP
jgi:hypothetical protein